MIKVSCQVRVIEIDGNECAADASPLEVFSHWNQCSLVVLDFDGRRYTVSARDLDAAIKNATNTVRF